MKRFEELLDAFENAATDLDSEPGGSAHFGGYKATYTAARSALNEYVRERTAEADRLRHEIEHPHDAAEFDALRRERDAAVASAELRHRERMAAIDAGIQMAKERDAARRELCEASTWVGMNPASALCDAVYMRHGAKDVAASRNWSYLYAPAPPATWVDDGRKER